MPNTEQYKQAWRECLEHIQRGCSQEEFSQWFSVLEPIGYEGGMLRIAVPNKEHSEYIERNYIPLLRPIIRKKFGVQTRLQYAIPNTASATTKLRNNQEQNTIKNPFVIPGIKKVQFDPQLRTEFSFENFIEGDCNRLARSAGRSISITPGKTAFNPLFVFGNSGLGKTHLAQAIGNEIKQRDPNARVLYVSCDKFQSQFQHAVFRKELNDFIYFYQTIDVLIVDDIQQIADKPGTQNIFFNIFNHLKMLGKQIILTADRPPVELKGIEERLISRFKWGLPAELSQPDYKTRLAILHNKAKSLGLKADSDVFEFLAENIRANVRELEGALTTLDANTRLLGKRTTLELTRSIMRNIVSFTLKEVTVDTILDLVCSVMGVERRDVISTCRTRTLVSARQVAMYICKERTKTTLSVIGKLFGNRTHATVMHACRTVPNLLETDKILRGQVDEILRKLQY